MINASRVTQKMILDLIRANDYYIWRNHVPLPIDLMKEYNFNSIFTLFNIKDFCNHLERTHQTSQFYSRFVKFKKC